MTTLNTAEPLIFQVKDILARDIALEAEDGSSEDASSKDYESRDKFTNKAYQILLFGNTVEGKSVSLTVNKFKPFFYVRIPDVLANDAAAKVKFQAWVSNKVPESCDASTDLVWEQHKTLYGFNDGAKSTFLKIQTQTKSLSGYLKDLFLTKNSTPKPNKTSQLFGEAAVAKVAAQHQGTGFVQGDKVGLKVYESNIDPMLRFCHLQDISPANWVEVPADLWEEDIGTDAKMTLKATADYMDVKKGKDQGMSPFTIASWDIECTSSHGDFPQANKTYRKPLRELVERGLLTNIETMCKHIAEAFAAPGTLSRIYLKQPRTYLPETLRLQIVGKGLLDKAKELLTATAAATTATHRGGITISGSGELVRDVATDESEDEGEERGPLEQLDALLTSCFPPIRGDPIIQIGTVVYCRGAPVSKHIWVLGTVDEASVKPPGVSVPISVHSFGDELLMLKAWFQWIGRFSPDVLIGYNIFGFDSRYVYQRLEQYVGERDAVKICSPLSCLRSRPSRLEEKFLSSAAMGDNTMYFLSSPGRLQIDLLPYIRRNHNLDSYTLDNVSATFVSGSVKSVKPVDAGHHVVATKSTKGIVPGRYITLLDEENDRVLDRVLVTDLTATSLTIAATAAELADHGTTPVRWAQVKDDVSPKDIFRLHEGSAVDRATIARYCLQDCDLVMELFNKLEILNNSFAMADVCSVPVGFIFLRGQGVKIESLIFKECRKVDQLIEVLSCKSRDSEGPAEEEEEEADTYEGAIVLEPKTGIYHDPVSADDFSSLYPSSIISENISHDTHVSTTIHDKAGAYVGIEEGSAQYDNLPGREYVDITFDILRKAPGDMRKHPETFPDGTKTARYVQGTQGTIPRILQQLLASRKATRKLAEKETDEFRKALLDAQQLAYKLTANSLYGQLGSGTFKIRMQTLAASTTAYGRKQLMFAKQVIEAVYGPGKDPRCDAEVVYGDTDSLFLRFQPKDPKTGVRLTGKAALQAAKDLTVESGQLVTGCLKAPHDFEFDKIFRTFCLLSKKRYVGDMSEDGVEDDDFHRKSMGIVMKRRDNAPIVKYVYGGVVDRLLDPAQTDAKKAVADAGAFVRTTAEALLRGEFPLRKLTITKSLRAEYADPQRIAHKVLADRIGVRDPGNKPSTSDRIPFVYIATPKGKPVPKLQGDRIETPAFITANKLQPDYAFYITNQISKPVSQVFGLVVEDLPGMQARQVVKATTTALRESLASEWLFKDILVKKAQEVSGQRTLLSLVKAK
jgi:DNA polymerase elongation subunit (family B)